MLHIFEPVETGRPVGPTSFTASGTAEDARFPAGNTASVGHSEAMYAATIESELDTEKAFEYIAGAPQGQKDNPLINILDKFSTWYDTNNVTLGVSKFRTFSPVMI